MAPLGNHISLLRNSRVLIPLACLCWSFAGARTAGDRSPFTAVDAVHVLFDVNSPDGGIFPTDVFTVADDSQKTGLRIRMPLPDCNVRPSDCRDLALINVLDGFGLQPRMTVPFDGDINPKSVNSRSVFLVELGDADIDTPTKRIDDGRPRVLGVNQLIWDPASHELVMQPDDQLRQHTRYAIVVTSRVVNAQGMAIEPDLRLERFRRVLDDARIKDSVLRAYQFAVQSAFAVIRRMGIADRQVAGLSVFTTQSATAVLEHIRDQLKSIAPAATDFKLGPGGRRTVFALNSIQDIDWQQQIRVRPPAFQSFKPQFPGVTSVLLLPDEYQTGAVGQIAYGRYYSPRYIGDEPVMPAVGTRAGMPPVQTMEPVYMNVFLPRGPPPPTGWPVVIFGLGGRDYKDEMPWLYAAAFASHGLATVCINVPGEAYGPLSVLKIKLKDGSEVEFLAGGRGKDLNGDGVIDDNEGIATISDAYKTIGPRDTIRQHIVDLMQLVRVLQAGVDVNGDGRAALDAKQISYFGLSFGGGALGPVFMAVETSVKVGVLASPAGMNSRFDLLRMRPAARAQVGHALADRSPPLINAPGLTSYGGVSVEAPFFDENIPLRNRPIVINRIAGAMDIQKYFDQIAWISGSGDGVSYVPHIRSDPLPGNAAKAILVNFAKGDLSAPNPRTTQFLRAGALADATTLYRNDLAYVEDQTVFKNPHTYIQRWLIQGLSGPIGRAGLEQAAVFLASHGQTTIHPKPSRFFEVPITLPLPEDFSYIP